MMSICRETWLRVLPLSKKEHLQKEKVSEVKTTDKKEKKPAATSDRDHYVYESIIAEIGY